MTHPLCSLLESKNSPEQRSGITSVCSAHPIVIEAALRLALETGRPALIEATCNQVNQDGGYAGMTPSAFRAFVEGIAEKVGLERSHITFGGDHLGPNPWKDRPAEQAMAKAEEMVAAFAAAGFTKLHLDCSMGCLGEPVALSDDITAERAARLAARAEAACGSAAPVYVIGTEVPLPGGSVDGLVELQITTPESVVRTYSAHQRAFAALGQHAAFGRVIAMVVQPGVEFGHANVHHFDPESARTLSECLASLPSLVFEAHSTDYQTDNGLAALVAGGFAILKVGPWLTFALREALYALDHIADVLDGAASGGGLMSAMEALMQAKPGHWRNYYHGSETDLRLQRHFSYSDRIRYYWPDPAAANAVQHVLARLSGKAIPIPLVSQYMQQLLPYAAARKGPVAAENLLLAAVQLVLTRYDQACLPSPAPASPPSE